MWRRIYEEVQRIWQYFQKFPKLYWHMSAVVKLQYPEDRLKNLTVLFHAGPTNIS